MTPRTIISLLVILATAAVASAQETGLPADPLSGRLVFEAKGCLNCHSLGGYGGTVGPDFAQEQFFGSAAELASALWDHIPAMNREYRRLGVPRPTLSESEMRQLMGFLYYLRYLGEPGSALRGKRLLEEKECYACHGSSGNSAAPEFKDLKEDVSPVNLVQAMWNHGPAMQKEATERGIPYPLLGPDDVGDISAYLQLAVGDQNRVRMSPGNPSRGKTVFQTKKCTVCHSVDGGAGKIGPDFHARDLRRSITQIASLMWNHAPLMNEYMKTERVEWPVFSGPDMADLIAYLYFLGFQDEPGDAHAGRAVFEEKRCANCHEAGDPKTGPNLATIRRPASVIGLAALMWNHASRMEDLLLARNLTWPQLNGGEMQNLFAYLHTHMKAGE